jgi:hypothetical protein
MIRGYREHSMPEPVPLMNRPWPALRSQIWEAVRINQVFEAGIRSCHIQRTRCSQLYCKIGRSWISTYTQGSAARSI